jgi:hypothetical protein
VEYQYDKAGNRVKKLICVGKCKAWRKRSPDSVSEETFEEQLGELEISIYPNPTANQLNIKFTNKLDNISYQLLDVRGKVLRETQNAADFNTIDISNEAKGQYFLRIINGKEVSNWKIIKS